MKQLYFGLVGTFVIISGFNWSNQRSGETGVAIVASLRTSEYAMVVLKDGTATACVATNNGVRCGTP